MARLTQTDAQQLAKAFKALSHPNRMQIYCEIMSHQAHQIEANEKECLLGGRKLAEFIHSLNVGVPTISHHIKELVNAGLITVERNGKYMTCFPNEPMREQLKRFFENLR
jgi:ArsR family transcriptional regulator, arsenate/arsenite/antimonite-responsive transcriptional repressor